MYIEEKIILNDNIYFVRINTEYRKDTDGMIKLFYKDQDKIFDGGDLSVLIKKIEDNYSNDKISDYDTDIFYLKDIFYIYDNILFLSGIEAEYDNSRDYISREEIEKYKKLIL